MSRAAGTSTSAHLRWYTRPSGARAHHRVSHLPSFRIAPALPAPAEGAGSLAAWVVIAAATTPPLESMFVLLRP